MLPVVAGRAETKRQIVIYSVVLLLASMLPWVLGMAGHFYAVIAATSGVTFVVLALRLRRGDADRRPAYRLFAFSIAYLFMLFAAILADGCAPAAAWL
jgi:protoheme IX farnesyltransferase